MGLLGMSSQVYWSDVQNYNYKVSKTCCTKFLTDEIINKQLPRDFILNPWKPTNT